MPKIIIITGVSSGIGMATAELLAAEGHKVYGFSRRKLDNPHINSIQLDINNRQAVKQAVNQIVEKEGRVDVLINNAGIGIGGAAELATEEEINLQMTTNFFSTVDLCKNVLPFMRQQGKGKIINISSIGGVMGLPYQSIYSASKFAIEGFSEALSAEVKEFGIKIILVEPGDFATGFTSSRRISQPTLNDPQYAPRFKQSLQIIEKEENNGLPPKKLAKKILHIINSKHPSFRYVVANTEQWLSTVIKRILPSNTMINILKNYYKS